MLQHCNSYIQALGLTDVRAEDILDIIEGYIGEKYGTATEEVLGTCSNLKMLKGLKMIFICRMQIELNKHVLCSCSIVIILKKILIQFHCNFTYAKVSFHPYKAR